jgi:glutamyl/glutaminyl-tRNA synthetase
VFLHHPLIRKADGAKLSKSSGDTGIGELRRAGASAERVLGRAAWLAGLLDRPRDVGAEDLESLFWTV